MAPEATGKQDGQKRSITFFLQALAAWKEFCLRAHPLWGTPDGFAVYSPSAYHLIYRAEHKQLGASESAIGQLEMPPHTATRMALQILNKSQGTSGI